MKINLQSISSIKAKLLGIMMLVGISTTLLCLIISTIWGIHTINKASEQELALNAQLLGSKSAAALMFDNKTFSQETFSVFANKNNIISACIYDRNGNPFSSYQINLESCGSLPREWNGMYKDSVVSSWHEIIAVNNIISEGEVVGAIRIISSQQQIYQHIYNQFTLAIVMILGAVVVSFILSSWLQKFVSQPISEMAHTTEMISQNPELATSLPNFREKELSRISKSLGLLLDHVNKANCDNKLIVEKYSAALRANNGSLNLLKKAFGDALGSVAVVTELFRHKPMGDQLDPYECYLQDINNSLDDYKLYIDAVTSLSKEYEDAIQTNKTPISVFEDILGRLNILKKQDIFGNFNIVLERSFMESATNNTYLFHRRGWNRLNTIIFELLPAILIGTDKNDATKMALSVSFKENDKIAELIFEISPESQDRNNAAQYTNAEEWISSLSQKVNNANDAAGCDFFDENSLRIDDFKFIIESARYIANVNNITINSWFEYPWLTVSYIFDNNLRTTEPIVPLIKENAVHEEPR